MPTKEELDLFCQMDGGHPEESEVLHNLSQVVQVPENQLRAFVKTRDRSTIQGLRRVLQEIPKRDAEVTLRPSTVAPGTVEDLRSTVSARSGLSHASRRPTARPQAETLGRVSTAPGSLELGSALGSSGSCATPKPRRSKAKNQERLAEMMSMTSTYNNFYSPGGKQVSKHPKPHANAYAPFSDGFKRSFKDWEHTAPEAQVKSLADASRALQYFTKSGASMTTYGDMFPRFSQADMKDARCNLPDKDMTVSNVPIGSLGFSSESEKAAKEGRDRLYETQIAMARGREKAILDGTLMRPENRAQMSGSYGNLVVKPVGPEIGEDQGVPAPSRDWKALARASFHSGMHSQLQLEKHDVTQVKQGHMERKEQLRRDLFARTMTDVANATNKDSVFNVSNPKDASGKTMTRFTYSKWAGFVP